MDLKEYQNIFEKENAHWWYRSLHELVLVFLRRITKNEYPLFILDAGCGTGGMIRRIKEKYPRQNLFGIDISERALAYARQRSFKNLSRASVERLPFKDSSMDVIVSLDVLYHLSVYSDKNSISEMHRVLKNGGYIILHLPAFKFLRGAHDEVVQTARRYNKKELIKKVEQAGFKIIRCSYHYAILFPVLFFRRIFNRCNNPAREAKSDLKDSPLALNKLLAYVFFLENTVVKYFDLPIGTSLFCLCKKF